MKFYEYNAKTLLDYGFKKSTVTKYRKDGAMPFQPSLIIKLDSEIDELKMDIAMLQKELKEKDIVIRELAKIID